MALKFGTSGVRGLVTEMTDRACMLYAAAFVELLMRMEAPPEIAIGGDLRGSTPRIMEAVAAAARERGFGVINCGRIPTPALAEYALRRGIGAVMVTGSHIPNDRNGIKFYRPDGEILKPDEVAIAAGVRTLAASGCSAEQFDAKGMFLKPEGLPAETLQAAELYRRRYLGFFAGDALAGLKLVLYEHSAVGRDLIAEVLGALGAEVVRVGRSEHFVAVDTEAVDKLAQLKQWVLDNDADALLSTDGDSDRPLLLDGDGEQVRGDVMGVLAAKALKATAVATPVSCNSAVDACGAFERVVRTRIGSPYVIAAMLEFADESRVVGFEPNGGFLTGSDVMVDGRQLKALPTRDSLLPMVAVLSEARRQRKSVAELVGELPPRFTDGGLLREFPFEKGQAVAAHLAGLPLAGIREALGADFPAIAALDLTDGVRITFVDDTVIHFRPSGNAPEFRCYTEAADKATAAELCRRGLQLIDTRFRASADRWYRQLQVRENLQAMEPGGPGMDVVIVSTTGMSQAQWWRTRLLQGRGQVCNTDARIAVVVEDWEGGAGNGLGTLYAFERAAQLLADDGFDLLEALEQGAAVALYHTAGKGTRLAPLPAAEMNNKPGVRLPGIVELPGEHAAITILEAVIRQTAIYAPARRGRLSVFWGDQLFVPSAPASYRPAHHVDVMAAMAPMPTAVQWQARGLSSYGLLAVDGNGDATQIEKVSYETVAKMIADGTLDVAGGIGISLGSFSMSAALTEALLAEFADELREKRGRLDTDPHFWMPLALAREPYVELMHEKGMMAAAAAAHYDRMQRLAGNLRGNYPGMGLIGALDVGDDGYWWDYGRVDRYLANCRKTLAMNAEGRAMREFFQVEAPGSWEDGDLTVINSVLLDCRIKSGRIENSVLLGVECDLAECSEAVVIGGRFEQLTVTKALAYNCGGKTLELTEDQVAADVVYPGEAVRLQTELGRDGGQDWQETLPGNAMSYAAVYQRNRGVPMQTATAVRRERQEQAP